MPISVDGEDIIEITIDGEPVKEVTMDGELYWVQGIILYHLGEENTAVTGGWEEGYEEESPQLSKENDHLYILAESTSREEGTWRTANKINLAAGDRLIFNYEELADNNVGFETIGTAEDSNERLISDISITSDKSAHVGISARDDMLGFYGPCELKLYTAVLAENVHKIYYGNLRQREEESDITCLHVHPDTNIMVSGEANGNVRIWEVNDPSMPYYIVNQVLLEHSGAVQRVLFDGDYLYAAWQDAVRIYDVSNPFDAVEIAEIELDDTINEMYKAGDVLAIADQDRDWVRIYDVGFPDFPEYKSLLPPFDDRVLTISIKDNILVCGLMNATVEIFDVSDMDNPSRLGEFSVDRRANSAVLSDTNTLIIGTYEFDNAAVGDVRVYNISDPEDPELLTVLDYHHRSINQVSVFGNFVAAGSRDNTWSFYELGADGIYRFRARVCDIRENISAISMNDHVAVTGHDEGYLIFYDISEYF